MEMPEDHLIDPWLEANREGMKRMLLTEYDEAKTMELFKEEGCAFDNAVSVGGRTAAQTGGAVLLYRSPCKSGQDLCAAASASSDMRFRI